MEPELGGWGGLWARLGLWGIARDVPERPTGVPSSLLPNDRGVLGYLCGRPEVKVRETAPNKPRRRSSLLHRPITIEFSEVFDKKNEYCIGWIKIVL